MSVRRARNGFLYFSVRITDRYGKQIHKKVQNSKWKTKKEAFEAEKVFLESLSTPTKEISYKHLWEQFIQNRSSRIKARTSATYIDIQQYHILPEFATLLVSKISKNHIRKWQKELLSKGYSNSYMKNIQINFKRVLMWGENNDMIEKNPFTIDYVKHVDQRKKEIPFFTLEDYNKFHAAIESETDELIFDILYWCGLRKGELFALKFSDIDLLLGTMKIDKTYDYRNHLVTTPKNNASYREILLTSNLKLSLTAYIAKCNQIAGFTPDLFLFGIDKPLSTSTLERKRNNYCQQANIQKINIHAFRHSHVSLLINNGFNVFDIAKRLGHSSDMVNNTYGHWFKKNQEKLVNRLDRIQDEAKNNTAVMN